MSTVRCLKVLDGRPIAVSGSRDNTLRVWDIERGVLVHVLSGHQHSVRCIEISGNRVVSGSYDATCKVSQVAHLQMNRLTLTCSTRSGTSTLANVCILYKATSTRFTLSHSMATVSPAAR